MLVKGQVWCLEKDYSRILVTGHFFQLSLSTCDQTREMAENKNEGQPETDQESLMRDVKLVKINAKKLY